MQSPKLRFTHDPRRELLLAPGVHAVGRTGPGEDAIDGVEDGADAIARFCVDRRGVWLTVAEGARGVHVNGRAVQRMAMLRLGDAVYVEGVEMLLVSDQPSEPPTAALPAPAAESSGDPRVLLRGVGGRYHGRSFTLQVPRLIGSAADADIRIDEPTFAERHARIELSGDAVVLRDLGSADGSILNGEPVRDAVLHAGDQLVFDGHHRFVIEAPATRAVSGTVLPELGDGGEAPARATPLARSARRLPWLLVAAALLATGLAALLLFGAY